MSILTIEIPKELMSKLKSIERPLQDIVLEVLTRHVQAREGVFTITQTRTWQLCGTLEVSEPEPEYVSGKDEQGQIITNYAEHVNEVLSASPFS